MISDQNLIAAYLAKHGATKCTSGESALDSRDIYKAMREGIKSRPIRDDSESCQADLQEQADEI